LYFLTMLFGEPYSDSSDDDGRDETVGDCPGAVDDSDEEIDDSDDPLKHAGVYTAEEIALITRDKLIQLQSLYAEYLNVLKRRYGRKRVEFHKRVKAEKDTLGPLWTSAITPRQRMKLEQLNAWRRYHCHLGEEGLLYQQSQKRRRLAAGISKASDNESIQLCNALVNGMDCGEVALPNSSMCAKHILCDGKQVLFFKCEIDDCRNVCVPASDIKYCWIHQRSSDGIRHDFNVPWTSFNQATTTSSSQQRSSVFASSAPPLRIFPPLSLSTNGDPSPTSAQSTPQKSSPVSSRSTTKKRPIIASNIAAHARRESVPPTKKPAPNRVGLVLPPTPTLTSTELRNAPPLPANKPPSFDDMSAEAGVYGAYMTSAEPSDGSGRSIMMETPVAGIRIERAIIPSNTRVTL